MPTTIRKTDLSWEEAADCADYAERVADMYATWNHGKYPTNADEAECAIHEYNKSYPFTSIYNYPIHGYIPHIIDYIGLIVAEMEGETAE